MMMNIIREAAYFLWGLQNKINYKNNKIYFKLTIY